MDRSARNRDILASTTLGVLLFSANVSAWTSAANAYYLRADRRDALLSCLLAMLIASSVSFAVLRLARRVERVGKGLVWVALPGALFALNRLRASTGISLPSGLPTKLVIGFLLGGILYATVKNPKRAGQRLHLVFRWGAAFAAMVLGTLAQSLFFGPSIDPEKEGGVVATKPLIIWAVFDELDQGWLFDHRPAELKLPNFDRLAAQSLTCSHVVRPGPETLFSIPALTIGRPVKQSTIVSSRDLELTFEGGSHGRWSASDTIFSTMKKRGRTVAIDGFYHNYPGVFRGQVEQVKTTTYLVSGFWPMLEENFWLLMPGELRLKGLAVLGRASLLNVVGAREHRDLAGAQMASLTRTFQSRSADFIFFHCRIPHRPWMLDPRTGERGYVPGGEGYFGNLKVADDLLGQMMKTLEDEGRWDGTTLLLTSDHNLRESLRGVPKNELVPLILKLPNQRKALRFDGGARAIDERWLLEGVESGQVKTADQAAEFLGSKL